MTTAREAAEEFGICRGTWLLQQVHTLVEHEALDYGLRILVALGK
jgi:hypothetical protein